MNSMRGELEKALSNVGRDFEEDQLAFLTLTSKPELQIRDALAWRLHRALPDLIVSREWRRCRDTHLFVAPLPKEYVLSLGRVEVYGCTGLNRAAARRWAAEPGIARKGCRVTIRNLVQVLGGQ